MDSPGKLRLRPDSLHVPCLLPEPTRTSGFPRVTAAVKSEPRYSPSTCQFTNFDCWVCRGQGRRV